MIYLAVLCVSLTGCSGVTQESQCDEESIIGFWYVTNQMQNKGEVNFYAEIDERSIQYFQSDIDYLPLQYYSILDSCKLDIYSDSLRSLDDVIVGEVNVEGVDFFRVNGSTQTLIFERSSKGTFKDNIGREWID